MDTDFLNWIERQQGRQYELHSRPGWGGSARSWTK